MKTPHWLMAALLATSSFAHADMNIGPSPEAGPIKMLEPPAQAVMERDDERSGRPPVTRRFGREGSGVYYSFEQTDKMLREPADGTFRSTATPKDHGSSRKPSEVNQAEVAPGSGGKKGLFGFRNH